MKLDNPKKNTKSYYRDMFLSKKNPGHKIEHLKTVYKNTLNKS